MSILRTWTKTETALQDTSNPWKIWDRGDEIWELRDDILRHFSVVERTLNGEIITEKLNLLTDSPIPLEALEQEIQGWEVTEVQLQQEKVQTQGQAQTQTQRQRQTLPSQRGPQLLPRGPAFLPDSPLNVEQSTLPHELSPESQSHMDRRGKRKNHSSLTSSSSSSSSMAKTNSNPPQSSLTQSSHERQTPVIPNSQEEEQQQTCTLPAELWSSLSQWIPPNALFQPSLHHQAFLELSGTQGVSYPPQRDSEKHLQRSQGQRQHVKQSQGSKPYRQATSGQKTRVSAGPLFV